MELLLIESDDRGGRTEVIAQHVDGAWDAEVVRRTRSETKPHVDRVTCTTAAVAEERRVIYARRWVDLHGAG